MPPPLDAADSSTIDDRRAWLETFLEPASGVEATPPATLLRRHYSPRISTVLGLYLAALLTTGSVATYGLASDYRSTAEASGTDGSVTARTAHAPLPGPVIVAGSAAVRVPMRLQPASDTEAGRSAPGDHDTAVEPREAPERTDHHQLSAPAGVHVDPVEHTASVEPGPFNGLLEPAGIGRRFWRSFSHIPPYTGPRSEPARYVVMLDPGHGGTDPGSIGPNGLQEKNLTLDIARRTALFLSEISEIEVRLTRDDDTGMARHERVAKVRQSEADLIVSLHLNQLPQSDVTLTETYYAGPQNLRGAAVGGALVQTASGDETGEHAEPSRAFDFVADSARIAYLLQKSVFNEVGYDNPGAIDAGVKRRTLYVLSQSVTPGVLVEITCLSNPREEARLATEAYRNRLAAALADGIRAYFAQTDPLLVAENTL